MTIIRRTAPALLTSLLACAVGAAPAVADTAHEPPVPPTARTAPAAAGSRVASTMSTAQIAQALTTTASHSRYLRTQLSGMMMNPDTGAVTWSYGAGVTRMPASTQKLLTAYTVLHSMNVNTAFTTKVMQRNSTGSVFLRGEGDPSLNRTRLIRLARDTAGRLKSLHRSSVNVYYDAGYFPLYPATATGWPAGTLSEDAQLVRGLALADYRGHGNSALAAATVFARALSQAGVKATVKGSSGTPAHSYPLAWSTSAPVRSLLGDMLNVSDNDYAEFLLQQAARARGYRPGRAAALANMTRRLQEGHVDTRGLVTYDASGLSHADRMPARTMALVVRALWTEPASRDVVFAANAIPRSGQSGTLYNRFHDPVSSCATGRVLAKTGTLNGAVTLAGVALAADGTPRVFALLENGVDNTAVARLAVDHLAATIVGCHS